MNAPEHRKRNRRLGLILLLVFIGLSALVTVAMVTGNKAPPVVEKAVGRFTTPVLAAIGGLLVVVALTEIVLRIARKRARE